MKGQVWAKVQRDARGGKEPGKSLALRLVLANASDGASLVKGMSSPLSVAPLVTQG